MQETGHSEDDDCEEDDDEEGENKRTESSVQFNYAKYQEIRDELLLDVSRDHSQLKIPGNSALKPAKAEPSISIVDRISLFQQISDHMENETQMCFENMSIATKSSAADDYLLRESLLRVDQLEDLLKDEKKFGLCKFNNIIEHYGSILQKAENLKAHMELENITMTNKFQSIKDQIKSIHTNLTTDFTENVESLIKNFHIQESIPTTAEESNSDLTSADAKQDKEGFSKMTRLKSILKK